MDFEIDGPELAESGDAWRMMLIHDIYARVATSACRVAWRNPQRSHSVSEECQTEAYVLFISFMVCFVFGDFK